uniref:Uncharacterized protein n=1 Tax=Anguilla anguilla TaxID=7936 RepID=A0A0E9Q958_ANGAN
MSAEIQKHVLSLCKQLLRLVCSVSGLQWDVCPIRSHLGKYSWAGERSEAA